MPVDFVSGSWPCGHVSTSTEVPCPFCLQSKLQDGELIRAELLADNKALSSRLDAVRQFVGGLLPGDPIHEETIKRLREVLK